MGQYFQPSPHSPPLTNEMASFRKETENKIKPARTIGNQRGRKASYSECQAVLLVVTEESVHLDNSQSRTKNSTTEVPVISWYQPSKHRRLTLSKLETPLVFGRPDLELAKTVQAADERSSTDLKILSQGEKQLKRLLYSEKQTLGYKFLARKNQPATIHSSQADTASSL